MTQASLSQGYSTRIGQEVVIHYRWHALHGRPVRLFYSEKRRGADVVLVEGERGAGIVVAAWMLDPVACAALTIGGPQVSVAALCDLDRLLSEQGLRRRFHADDTGVAEPGNEERVTSDHSFQASTPTHHGAGHIGVERPQPVRTERDGRSVGPPADGSGRGRVRGGHR